MDNTPRLGDSDNNLLFKIAQSLIDASSAGGITQAQADVRYALKSGDTFTGAVAIGVDVTDASNFVVDPDSPSPAILTRHVADSAPAIFRVQKKGTLAGVNNASANNDNLVRYDFYAWDGSAFVPGAVFQLVANQAWTGSAHGARLSVSVVANGATLPTEVVRFSATALDLRNGGVIQSGGTQVLDSRKTGWTAATGTPSRATFDTASVTTAQLAQRVAALLDDLISHGLIGA